MAQCFLGRSGSLLGRSGSLLGRLCFPWVSSGSLLGRSGSFWVVLGRFWVAGDFPWPWGFLFLLFSLALFH